MPDEWNIPAWLPSALTGGVAATIIAQILNSLKSRSDAKNNRKARARALKQELTHALWLIKYNASSG